MRIRWNGYVYLFMSEYGRDESAPTPGGVFRGYFEGECWVFTECFVVISWVNVGYLRGVSWLFRGWMLGVYRVFRGYFVGVRCIINNPFAAKWQAVSSRRGRFIVPVYTCSPHIRKTLGHICNPFETHLCNVRNVFVICVLHIRRVKVWFLQCKKGVFIFWLRHSYNVAIY